MNYNTDGINGSNAQLTLVGTNPSGSSKTANIITQQPTGLIIQAGTGAPMQLWTNNSVVAQTLATDGSITMSYQLTLGVPPALSYSSVPTIGSTQIGFVSTNTGGSGTTATTSLSTALASITLNVGVYLFHCTVNTSVGTGSNALTASLYAGSTYIFGAYCLGSTTSSNSVSFSYCYANTANGTVFSVKALTSTGTMPITGSLIQAVRIA
jgi:hypothetical protein